MNYNTITTRYSTINNTCEEFSKKRRNFKGRKKKFKNFTSKDLKVLKNINNLGSNIMSLSKTSNNYFSEINLNKNNLSKKIIDNYDKEKNEEKENKEHINEDNKDNKDKMKIIQEKEICKNDGEDNIKN